MLVAPTEPTAIRLKDQLGAFLAVRSVSAVVNIDGPFAESTLTITFNNDTDKTVEGDLVFPLPPSAALSKLVVDVGGRRIDGKVRPRKRAQAEYARALESGKSAALGETEGEDLARLRVAPIDPGEDVAVTLGLVHLLTPLPDAHRLLLPLTYMPRFVEDEASLKPTERAALDRPRPLTLAARANVVVRARLGDRGEELKVRSTSHSIRTRAERGALVVEVGPAPLDRDLHLEIEDHASEPSLWVRHESGDGPDKVGPTTAVAIVPPKFADEGELVPRSVTFLIDRSGSMNGGPMASAIRALRGAIRALGPDDWFNVIAFDTVLDVLAKRPLAFDNASLKNADAFISSLTPRGGTSASMAIQAALRDAHDEVASCALPDAPPAKDGGGHRLRIVVFMTDGDVAGAEQVLKAGDPRLVDTRIHVIGIGHSVQHSMLSALASAGGGMYIPVATEEDLERALARLKNAIESPVWTGISISLDKDGERRAPTRLEPQGPIDLFGGQPVVLAFRGAVEPGEQLVVRGQRRDGEDLKLTIDVHPKRSAADDSDEGVTASTVWALLRNRRIGYRFDPADSPALEDLGISFGVVNREVALVGVHADARETQVEGSVPVALPLPAEAEGFAHVSFSAPPPGSPAPGNLLGHAGGSGAPRPMMAQRPMSPLASAVPLAPPGMGPPPQPAMQPPAMMMAPPAPPPPPPVPAPAPAMFASASAQGMLPTTARPEPPALVVSAPLTDDEAGLRALALHQAADGIFAESYAVTAVAVAALVSRGHSRREGLFRAELRRTVQTLRKSIAALSGDDRAFAALALALLTVPQGDAAPPELDPAIAKHLDGASLSARAGLRSAISLALGAAPSGLRSVALALEIVRVFKL